MAIELGCGQITWPTGAPEDDVLEDIRKAGYEGVPWAWHLRGRGRDSRSAEDIRAELSRHNLKPAPGYLGGDFWETERRDEFVAQARRYAEVSAALGLRELYVAAGGFNKLMPSGRTRRQAAAHATPEDSLTKAEFEQFADGLNAVAAISRPCSISCRRQNSPAG